MKEKQGFIRFFVYARKSSESEDRQVASIDSQINELTKLANQRNLEIVDVLSESRSAKDPGRPIFNEMLSRIHKGEANGIIAWKLDRLARNPMDGGQISWMLQQGIVRQIVTFDRSYHPEDNVITMSVELGMANQFIRDLSVNTKRGLRCKAERGWYPHFATLGYMPNHLKKKGDKEILIDPERFSTVRKMWDLLLSGSVSPKKIVEIATKEWALTNRRGGKLSQSNIYRIFSDPFYYGRYEYPKGSGNWYDGVHTPMISREEFEKAQVILGRKSFSRPKNLDFAYRGPIYCGECGSMITAEAKVKRQKNGNVHFYTYYHCTKKKNPECSQKCISEENLKGQIEDYLQKICIPEGFCEWAMKQLKLENKKEAEDREQIKTTIQKRYNACVSKIDALIDMRASNELSSEEYANKRSELMQEKDKAQTLLNDLDERVDKWIDKAEEIFNFAKTAADIFNKGTLEQKKTTLASLGSNLTLRDGKLSIILHKPLKLIEDISKEAKEISERFEPLDVAENKRTLEETYSQSPLVLRRPDSNWRPAD